MNFPIPTALFRRISIHEFLSRFSVQRVIQPLAGRAHPTCSIIWMGVSRKWGVAEKILSESGWAGFLQDTQDNGFVFYPGYLFSFWISLF